MLLGLLVYEMATGNRPFGDIYPLTTVVLALLHDKVKLNVEADHFLQKQGHQVRTVLSLSLVRMMAVVVSLPFLSLFLR